jgi:hypothetical protein
MFMTIDVYLKRIYHTLEHVIAPEVEDDFARGQVFAVINLLEQLAQKVEYKRDLISQEIEQGSRILKSIAEALEEARVGIPDELESFMKEVEKSEAINLSMRNKLEEKLSLAMRLFNDNKGKLDKDKSKEVDKELRDYITKIATRDLGLMKPPAIDKISRPEKKAAKG